MPLPRVQFTVQWLLVVVVSAGIGLGIVANLDRLSGPRRRAAYRLVCGAIALAGAAWYAAACRSDDPPADPPGPE